MNTAPKVGVLMAVYAADDPNLFRRAVQSIINNQTAARYTTIRVYLGVDGPVGREMVKAITELSECFYRLFWFQANRGLVHVLNDLIAAREDEAFFFRMDADDVSLPTRFERQLQYMGRNPSIEILGTDIIEIEEGTGRRRIVRFADSPDEARQRIARGVPVAHPTVCFRATVFQKVPQYPLVRLNEDIEMWFACLQSGVQFDNVKEPLYEFRIGAHFWKRRGWKKTWTEFIAYVKGIWKLDGVTWKYVFPIARLLLRLAPSGVKRAAYGSTLRKTRTQTS
jgi:hypothetical protein